MQENQKPLKIKSIGLDEAVLAAVDQKIELKKEFLPVGSKVGDEVFLISDKNSYEQKSAKELLNEILGME